VSGNQEVTYTLELGGGGQRRRHESQTPEADRQPREAKTADQPIPRIARLMALAIQFQGQIHEGTFRDYAEVARLGRVTRGRMTQIMKLLHLAPDIQEQILFLPVIEGFNERNLRPIVRLIDWDEQRTLFRKMMARWMK
jgi:hypothetical protein